MKRKMRCFFKKRTCRSGNWFYVFLFLGLYHVSFSATGDRIHYAKKDIFISGINIAWVNFASDLGPNAVDTTQLKTEFQTVHSSGGNVMRFWLNTNGANTPEFNSNGYVSGPGSVAIANLKIILDLAKANNIGLILCLWSHDMLNISALDSTERSRNTKLLTDTSYTNTYIRNALIPMVDAVKGHSAIVAWEILNEPEGLTTEYGWSTTNHVPMASVQQFINLTAGAIHRTDTGALVTSGAVTFQTLTDVSPSASVISSAKIKLLSMSSVQKQALVQAFNLHHRTSLTAEEYSAHVATTLASTSYNYYQDDRLKVAGGDSLGTLDFYCVHYYTDAGSQFSPFLYPASHWGLTKPIVVGEFYTAATDGVSDVNLFSNLYSNGYAGAMAWSWTDFGALSSMADTWINLKYMFDNHRDDIITNPVIGTIYVFAARNSTIEKTDSTYVRWDVEPGSAVQFNGSTVTVKDSIKVSPVTTTTYTLVANGTITDTNTVTVTVLPYGRIVSFAASPTMIGTGESTTLKWHVVKGSTVTLNDSAVKVVDTLVVYPTVSSNSYTLRTQGDVADSSTVTISVGSPDQVDRAYGVTVTASSNDTASYKYSNPKYIVDENDYSRWQSTTTKSQTVLLDLGMVDTIKTIVITWGNKAYAKAYSIDVSTDNSTWSVIKTIYSGTGGTNYTETFSNLSSVGRYIDLLLQTPGTLGYYSIAGVSVYGRPTLVTDIESSPQGVPTGYSLSQNYPNPFNPSTTIKFTLKNSSMVKLTIYNILGQKIATLVDGQRSAGYYSVPFNGSRYASGVYFYRLETHEFQEEKKMLLIK